MTTCGGKAAESYCTSPRGAIPALCTAAKGKAVPALTAEPQQSRGESGRLSTEQWERSSCTSVSSRSYPRENASKEEERRSETASYVAPKFSAAQIGQHWEI